MRIETCFTRTQTKETELDCALQATSDRKNELIQAEGCPPLSCIWAAPGGHRHVVRFNPSLEYRTFAREDEHLVTTGVSGA